MFGRETSYPYEIPQNIQVGKDPKQNTVVCG